MTPRRVVAAAGFAAIAIALVLALTLSGHQPPRDPPIVRVELLTPTGSAEVATGFAVGSARVVTVAHVLDRDRRLVVLGPDGRPRPARVVRTDRRDDLALIAVPGLAGHTLSRATGGDRLLVRRGGRTAPLNVVVRRRIRATVRGPDWGPYVRPALELRGAVHFGDSGAPLVDRGGSVAGVLFARSDTSPGTAYAVDVSAVKKLLSPLPRVR